MVIRKLFGRKDDERDREYSIDDLIVLERWEEAEAKLRDRIKIRNDLHDHLKLADVYVEMRQVAKSVDEYVFVADEYARDGFYERAIAVLSKARRLNPMDDNLPKKVEKYEASKKLELKRAKAQEAFIAGLEGEEGKGTAVVEFQGLWQRFAKSSLVKELDDEQSALFFKGFKVQYVPKGQTLVERGKRHDTLYFIVNGVITASMQNPDAEGEIDVRNFGPGDILGESALFQKSPWPATYRANQRTALMRLDEKGLEVCLTGNPDPRGFLDVLRRKANDREVAKLVAQMENR